MTDNTEALPPFDARGFAEEAKAFDAWYPGPDDAKSWAYMAWQARAALAQRQQVPDAVAALLRIASRLENMGRPQAANGVRLAVLELEKDAALTAAPSAQAEPQDPLVEDRARTAIERYNELLMAVGNKYPGETRHETALRYIRRAEQQADGIGKQESK